MNKIKVPEGYGNTKDYHKIFNDNIVDSNHDFKLGVAIETNEVRFNFYNLKTKEFSETIDIKDPFLVNTRMCSWNLLERDLKSEKHYDNHFKYYSFNRELGKMINQYLKADLKFPVVEKEKFKQFKKLFISKTCTTKAQVKALVKYLRACITREYHEYDSDYQSHYVYKFMGNKETHKKVMILRETAINLEINVNFGYYYNLIKETEDKGKVLNHDSIRDFITSHNELSNCKNLRSKFKNSKIFAIHLQQHESYLKILDDDKKNTLSQVKKLLEINSNLNSVLIPSVVINQEEFIEHCINKNYRKPLLTHPLLNTNSDFIFNYISKDERFFKTEIISNFPKEAKKKIKLDKELSLRISLMISNNANKIYNLLMMYDEINIDKFNNEFNKFIEICQITNESISKHHYGYLKNKNKENITTKKIGLILDMLLLNTQIFCQYLHPNAFTTSLFNSFIQFLTLRNEDKITTELVKDRINNIKEYFYQKEVFAKFPMKVRNKHELEAISQDFLNINKCSISTKRKKDVILLATKTSFLNLNYNNLKNFDLNLFAEILKSNLEFMNTFSNDEPYCIKYTKYSHTFLNNEIKQLIEQSGFAKRLNNFKIVDNWNPELISYEDIQNLLKACNHKIMSDKYKEKAVKTKVVKI